MECEEAWRVWFRRFRGRNLSLEGSVHPTALVAAAKRSHSTSPGVVSLHLLLLLQSAVNVTGVLVGIMLLSHFLMTTHSSSSRSFRLAVCYRDIDAITEVVRVVLIYSEKHPCTGYFAPLEFVILRGSQEFTRM